ncbi:MAG TPA: molecular chaperone DnaK [Streptomyces sp.]|nr:molecular chaperone DnaK [Streptomyces sp.]
MKLNALDARQRLEHDHATRTAQLAAMDDPADRTADGPAARQAHTIRGVLKEIEQALDRLAEGTYGNCQGCAKPIPAERLEILPYASRCVGCQSRAV